MNYSVSSDIVKDTNKNSQLLSVLFWSQRLKSYFDDAVLSLSE